CFRIPITCVSLNFDLVISSPPPTSYPDRKLYSCLVLFYGRVTVCNPTISTSTNRISQSGYSFDANGNLTANAEGERFSYDAENHQTEYFDSSNSGSTPDATYYYS
ncbi:MAG: hypothetical protein K1X36_08865, partial [Pyrinomonadaceae bacterium]|nr:hypothetical protein [Pyrinomonadaceae bacterium]